MKTQHIIIDGSDNLGKTTVLKQLSEELKLPIIKMPNMSEYIKNENAEEFSKLFNETIVQFAEHSFLMDRGFTSSLVYSKVFRRSFDLSYITKIEKILKPKVFILTGRNIQGGRVSYVSFQKDPIYKEDQKKRIDSAFCTLAYERDYPLIEVAGRTSSQVKNEILALL